jgi:sec-independent protein translocase protein TatC
MNHLIKYSYKDHFLELKTRLYYTVVFFIFAALISYIYKESIGAVLIDPLLKIKLSNTKVIYTSITEAFLTYLELSLFVASLVTIPFLSYQIYCFTAPGLYKNERAVAKILFILAPCLFICACLFVYFLVIPNAWNFFLSFDAIGSVSVLFEAKISEYLGFVIKLMIAFGVAFELPVILIILFLLKIISLQGMIKKRRISIVVNFILAGILTPPDILSQFMLAIPMCLLYESAILICGNINKRMYNND